MLPHDFLSRIACEYTLSEEQEKTFLERFGSDKSEQAVADAFHVSRSAIANRLTEIYKKFSVGGKGPGKYGRLLLLLSNKYQTSNASHPYNPDVAKDELNSLVQRVRLQHRDKIQDQCGSLRMLNIARQVRLENIYVDVSVLEEPPSQRWLDLSVVQSFNPYEDGFDRFGLGMVGQERVLGLETAVRNPKLFVLGKPGSGKTTFLQYLAIQCNRSEFQAEMIPVFIWLKSFAQDGRDTGDFSLVNYISREFCSYGISAQEVETLLNHGRALVLIDGLDEVQKANGDAVLNQISRFSEQYYRNQFVITCRIAAQKYKFRGFTHVEVADFDHQQIESFARKWFVAVAKNSREEGLTKATQFIKKLKHSENKQLRELAVTPLLLNLTCLVFQEKGDFPSKRSKLYEQGLNILFNKWDEDRGIERDEVYRNLSLSHKIKLLRQVAAVTFEQGNYFFEQDKIQQIIAAYLGTSSNGSTDADELHLSSEAVLKAIEAQHGLLVERAQGIYSFSHLTFQEYLTAREFVTHSEADTKTLENLVNHISEKRWRGVFLLTAEMLPRTDSLLLLMKQRIEAMIASNVKLQQFLLWLNQKFFLVQVPHKPIAVRIFYLSLLCLDDVPNIARGFAFAFRLVCAIDHVFDTALGPASRTVGHALNDTFVYDNFLDLALSLSCSLTRILTPIINFFPDPGLKRLLQQLIDQLPDSNEDREKFEQWWKGDGKVWAEQLKALLLKHHNIIQKWQLSEEHKETLEQHYAVFNLLADCLNSASNITPTVREEIEETWLLPISEIERRRVEGSAMSCS